MNYLLSQQEYDDLVSYGKKARLAVAAELQDLCIKVADHMPIKYWGRTEATPWGCILTVRNGHYCDECPVRVVCPYEGKQWSK